MDWEQKKRKREAISGRFWARIDRSKSKDSVDFDEDSDDFASTKPSQRTAKTAGYDNLEDLFKDEEASVPELAQQLWLHDIPLPVARHMASGFAERARSAQQGLTKVHIQDLKALSKPPEKVLKVLQVVMHLLSHSPRMRLTPTEQKIANWTACQKMMSDMCNFLEALNDFPQEVQSLPMAAVQKAQEIIDAMAPDYTPEQLKKTSIVAELLCKWSQAAMLLHRAVYAPETLRSLRLNRDLRLIDALDAYADSAKLLRPRGEAAEGTEVILTLVVDQEEVFDKISFWAIISRYAENDQEEHEDEKSAKEEGSDEEPPAAKHSAAKKMQKDRKRKQEEDAEEAPKQEEQTKGKAKKAAKEQQADIAEEQPKKAKTQQASAARAKKNDQAKKKHETEEEHGHGAEEDAEDQGPDEKRKRVNPGAKSSKKKDKTSAGQEEAGEEPRISRECLKAAFSPDQELAGLLAREWNGMTTCCWSDEALAALQHLTRDGRVAIDGDASDAVVRCVAQAVNMKSQSHVAYWEQPVDSDVEHPTRSLRDWDPIAIDALWAAVDGAAARGESSRNAVQLEALEALKLACAWEEVYGTQQLLPRLAAPDPVTAALAARAACTVATTHAGTLVEAVGALIQLKKLRSPELQVLAESYGQLAPAAPNPFITPLLRELRVAPGIHKVEILKVLEAVATDEQKIGQLLEALRRCTLKCHWTYSSIDLQALFRRLLILLDVLDDDFNSDACCIALQLLESEMPDPDLEDRLVRLLGHPSPLVS
eukprot:g24777.t1